MGFDSTEMWGYVDLEGGRCVSPVLRSRHGKERGRERRALQKEGNRK